MTFFKTVLTAVVAAVFVGTAHVSAAPASDSALVFSGDGVHSTILPEVDRPLSFI